MARLTTTQLAADLEALRIKYEELAAERDGLRNTVAALNAVVDAATAKAQEYEGALGRANADAMLVAALRTQLDALTTQYVAAQAVIESMRADVPVASAPVPAPARVVRSGLRKVFEFDPAVAGDYVRACNAAKEHNGVVRRTRA